MGIDSFYKKNSDDRAKRAIDLQWIKENETKEMIYDETGKLSQVQKRIDNIGGKTSGNLGDVSLRIDKLLAELDNLIESEQTDFQQQEETSNELNNEIVFLDGLNKCNNLEELKLYVDSIIDKIQEQQFSTKAIGATKNIFTKNTYENGGYYDGFISPNIEILNSNGGLGYHIYDRDYLYEFARDIRGYNLDSNTNLLPYIMPFLDKYFGLPKDQVDRREDVFFETCTAYAENFYKKNGISFDENMSAIDYMQLKGDFPLRALKGKNVAQCSERSCLAQNILKMCGYDSMINFGEAESRGKVEGHAWNIIRYGNGYLLIDFSNTAHEIENQNNLGRRPFSFKISVQEYQDYIEGKKDLITKDFHYENGEKVYENGNRIYAVGRSIDKINVRGKVDTRELGKQSLAGMKDVQITDLYEKTTGDLERISIEQENDKATKEK